MSINYNLLPEPGGIIPKGTYFAKIEKAEMKTPKVKADGTQNPDYLNLMLKIKDAVGRDRGVVWDIIAESSNVYAKYKLKRFIIALGIAITPDLKLKDLVKVAPKVKMVVDITQDNSEPPRNQVDIFTGHVYYHISEARYIFGKVDVFEDTDDTEDDI
jgi:hypothetical protein